MATYSQDTGLVLQQTSTPLTMIWGDFVTSPLWYMLFFARFFVLWAIASAFAFWDLVVTIFTSFWEIATNLLYIVPIIGIFIGLYFMHIHWAAFAHFLKHHFVPIIGVIYNDFILLITNDIFIPIASILIYMWDSLVQLIGFFIYFVLNLAVTIFTIIVQLIGQLNLPHLFEQVMEIVTPILKLAISILQLAIQIGSKIIVALIPVLIFMMKVVIQYIKIMAKIWIFIIVTIFKILAPILKAVVSVVRFVIRVFFHRGGAGMSAFAARSLLEFNSTLDHDRFGSKKDNVAASASHIYAWDIYSSAMRDYSASQFDSMFDQFDAIHRGIRAQDAFHSQEGYPLDPGKGVPDYTSALYEDEDLEEHERREVPSKRQPPAAQRRRAPRARHLSELDETRNQFLDAIRSLNKAFDSDGSAEKGSDSPSIDDWEELFNIDREDYEDEEGTPASASASELPNVGEFDSTVPLTGRAHRAAMSREAYYESLRGTEDEWRIDLSWNMTREQIFPHLKGKTLRRARLHDLIKDRTPEEMHEVRRTATAWRHAIEHGYYRVHKRHISSGQFHRAVANSWKHLTGHDTLESWAHEKFGAGKYVSVAHFIHSHVPDWTAHPLTRLMIRDEPAYMCKEPNGVCKYHHAWVREDLGYPDGMLPREFYEALEARERFMEEETYLRTGNRQPSAPLPEGDTEQTGGGLGYQPPTWKSAVRRLLWIPGMRQLLEIFGLHLEILYERDCFHHPKNILCIPQIPEGWKLPKFNVSAVFIIENLDDNPTCEKYGWKATDCIICWDGFVNALREVQFLIYWLDLISIILILGLFLPRPSELLGYLGKTFPPLSPFVNLFLLFPPGDFPPGPAWGCWFINLFYLFEFFIALMILYFILWPLVSWAQRYFQNIYQMWGAWRAGWIAHRADVEYYDEVRLLQIDQAIRGQMLREMRLRSNASTAGAAAPRINSELIGADIEQGVRQEPQIDMRRHYHQDPAANQMVFELEKSIGADLDAIAAANERLCTRLGVTGSAPVAPQQQQQEQQAEQAGARRPRVIVMPQAWQRITAVLQIPPELTPAFVSAQMQRRQMAEALILPGMDMLFGSNSDQRPQR